MYPRLFKYLKTQSFFLFGPRGTGKSSWLKQEFPQSHYIDLLDEALFQDYLRAPKLIKQTLNTVKPNSWVIIDEVQRLPQILNYVHKSLEERKLKFALTGSSARKLKRNHANLLAGRALQKKFNPLMAMELGDDFDIKKSVLYGHLPGVINSDSPKDYLKSYVGTYLREEVQQEALVRNLSTFARFLESAAYSQGQVLSVQSLGSDIGVDRKTAEAYLQILEDLLLAVRVPVFQKKGKRRLTTHPKFYYFDVGVYRTLRQRGPLDLEEEIQGPALETLVFQELKACIDNFNLDLEIFFYRTVDKHEVDFVLYGNDGFFAIEVKRGSNIRKEDLSSLKIFKADFPQAKTYLFYLGEKELLTDDKVHVVPIQKALASLRDLLFNP